MPGIPRVAVLAGALALAAVALFFLPALFGVGGDDPDSSSAPSASAAVATPTPEPTPEPAPTTQAEAAPENAPGITLGQARVQLPVVPGRPAVAYFTLSQANGAPRAVAAVHVAPGTPLSAARKRCSVAPMASAARAVRSARDERDW